MSHGFHPTGLFLANHSIFGVFEPSDRDAYLDAITPHFKPSSSPRVQVYVVGFDRVSPWPLTPYLEASVFVSVRHGVMEGWYPLMMPVTGQVARIGGRLRGFPKEMAEITLTENDDGWVGIVCKGDQTLLRLAVTNLVPIDEGFRDPANPVLRRPHAQPVTAASRPEGDRDHRRDTRTRDFDPIQGRADYHG